MRRTGWGSLGVLLLCCQAAALVFGVRGASAAGNYPDEVRADKPVAWWRFADASGAERSAAADETGQHLGAYHGKIRLEPGPEAIGGKAAAFDGKTAYVEVPDEPALALQTLSVEFWLRSNQVWNDPNWPASATLVSRATAGDGSGDWTLLGGAGAHGESGRLMARVGAAGRSDTVLESSGALNDGRWHHVVWTRETSGRNQLFVDGGLTAEAQDGGGSIVSRRPLQMGGDPWLKGAFLDGSMAEVAVYDKILERVRIRAHTAAGGSVVQPDMTTNEAARAPETASGWVKSPGNPVLGGALGTCFDISVLRDDGRYRMWFSWRPRASIALTESTDGIHWSDPVIVLGPNKATDWEEDINRPGVVKVGQTYHLWYTGQARGHSWIGYATSSDGKTWKRMSDRPVLSSEEPWEHVAVMCPDVMWDEQQKLFRMWYSAGEQYEPNAIGYATSPDGLHWTRYSKKPIFEGDPHIEWEKERATAVHVVKDADWYLMFYIGFRDVEHAQIGVARSRNGITGWERHPDNPIIRPGVNQWDHDACYKPYALFDGQQWLLWYNGRRGSMEQIGLAAHQGRDLGFERVGGGALPPARPAVLSAAALRNYVSQFSAHDYPPLGDAISNEQAGDWMAQNVPLLDCPDPEIEEIYYFRWWTYRKHIRSTPNGYVVTEFLPDVGWAGKYNTISCAAGHHLYEGRWIRDPKYLDDYSRFWFQGGGEPRRYSFWAADAIYHRFLVTGDKKPAVDLLDDLVENFEEWEKTHLDPNGLFWQIDDRDGMEVSIGGSGYRATINSYMYGDAVAISKIARLAGKPDVAARFEKRADEIRKLVQEKLWDKEAGFFKVLPRGENTRLVGVRELHGYTPWYFGLAEPSDAVAWKQLMNPQGFYAPFGPMTAERRDPRFMFQNPHECLWNGPSWPYATSVTLTAMANLLNDQTQSVVSAKDYFNLLKIYAHSQDLRKPDGTIVPWIDEDLNPDTGDWTARTILAKQGTHDRGKDYNHSTFCDLVISGLIGLRPTADNVVRVNPLAPAGTWDYFCLDQVYYHGRWLTILYDRTGSHYHRGKGLRVLVDGKEAPPLANGQWRLR